MRLTQLLWRQYMRLRNPSCTIDAEVMAKHVVLEEKVTIESGCYVGAGRIGKCTFIGRGTYIDKSTASIGRFCSIAMDTRISLKSHPMDRVSTHPFTYSRKYGYLPHDALTGHGEEKSTVIGHDVWIGANVTIMAGVRIGNGAVIGADSLVTRDVEPYSIVLGSPARHLRYRFDAPTIERLERSAWWDRDDAWIKAHVLDFRNVDAFLAVEASGRKG